MVTDAEKRALTDYLAGLVAQLPRQPRAMVVVSAHWEERVADRHDERPPPMLYDYYNFPPESYTDRRRRRRGSRAGGARARATRCAGFATAAYAERGYDHGTFVPMKSAFPDADVPTGSSP